jgi:hypothetical protein
MFAVGLTSQSNQADDAVIEDLTNQVYDDGRTNNARSVFTFLFDDIQVHVR